MFPAPIIVCRGCGKENTSMRAHLRKLSCQAKYTKEEYENFKIEAKQRSDMNKKHDPLLKERAKYLRKENAKKEKSSKQKENTFKISRSKAMICTNDTNVISKTKNELTKKDRKVHLEKKTEYKSTNLDANTMNKTSFSKSLLGKGNRLANKAEISYSNSKNSKDNYNMAVLTKSRVMALFDRSETQKMALHSRHRLAKLKADTFGVIINLTTDNPSIISKLKAIENETLNILNGDIEIPELEEKHQNEKDQLSLFIEMLQNSVENKQRFMENELNIKIQQLNQNPLAYQFDKKVKDLASNIKNLMKDITVLSNSTQKTALEIAENKIVPHAVEKFTHYYSKLFKEIDDKHDTIKEAILKLVKEMIKIEQQSSDRLN